MFLVSSIKGRVCSRYHRFKISEMKSMEAYLVRKLNAYTSRTKRNLLSDSVYLCTFKTLLEMNLEMNLDSITLSIFIVSFTEAMKRAKLF